MEYDFLYTKNSINDIKRHKKSGQKILFKKIENLISEIKETPRKGTGKPEQLRWLNDDNDIFSEVWSRRIDKKHRLTYEINEEENYILILSAYGHYDDK